MFGGQWLRVKCSGVYMYTLFIFHTLGNMDETVYETLDAAKKAAMIAVDADEIENDDGESLHSIERVLIECDPIGDSEECGATWELVATDYMPEWEFTPFDPNKRP